MAEQAVMELERQVKAMRAALNRIANFARRHNEPYDEEILNGGNGGWDEIARIADDALEAK